MVGLLGGSCFSAKHVMDRVERAVTPPIVEVSPYRAFGWKIDRQITPLAAGSEDVEDSADDISKVSLTRSFAVGNWMKRLDQSPLGIGDVARVMVHVHARFYMRR